MSWVLVYGKEHGWVVWGNLIFDLVFGQYVIAEAIRLVAPRYHLRMLTLARRLRAS
jgi:hypothetical protein